MLEYLETQGLLLLVGRRYNKQSATWDTVWQVILYLDMVLLDNKAMVFPVAFSHEMKPTLKLSRIQER